MHPALILTLILAWALAVVVVGKIVDEHFHARQLNVARRLNRSTGFTTARGWRGRR